ncbi:hypothetical protein TW65_02948 [Stemphylium lycopersici]|nr:hypothetical protein TW65_02948 [Stemphylium lycopersici]
MQSTRNDEPAGLISKNAPTDEHSSMASSPYPPAPRFSAADHAAHRSEEADNARLSGDQVTQIDYPRKLITPVGYYLGPSEEGWQSERSSLSRYQPSFPTSPSPRRERAKSNGLASCLKVPMPRTKPDYDIVAEYQGLKLGRISDAVPYLLGPRTVLDRIHIILEHKLQFAETIYPTSSTSSDTSYPYTPRDRALIAILTSLRTLEYTRRERGNWYPQGLATKHDALRLYKQSAKNGVKPVYLTLAEFLDKAAGRQRTPRPGDGVGAVNAWTDIAARLRERGVDVEKVDWELHSQLATAVDGQELERRIDEVAMWSVEGTLEQRYNAFPAVNHTPTTPCSLSPPPHPHPHHPAPATPTPTGTGLYSKRFTHKYPLGRPRSVVSDVEKAERRAQQEASHAILTHQQQQQARRGEVQDQKTGWWGRSKKKRNRVFFIAFMASIFGGVLGLMLWAMGTSRWDFTAKAETG